jgi:soluble lytic murein transglycosylase
MKRSHVVLNKRRYRSALFTRLTTSLLSLYIAHLSVPVASDLDLFTHRVESPLSEDRVIPALLDPDETHRNLVAEMIEREVPAHPEKLSLAQLIVAESRKADVDPLFIAAIVRAESMFKHKAVSRKGAQGLMQIMPATGRFIAKLSKIELKEADALHNPETNIKLGVWYVRYLLTKFKGDRERMLVAYNWGPSNMLKAIAGGTSLPKESVHYVHKVLSHHTTWTERLAQFAALRSESSLG